jgi:hypothetical protein
MLIGHSMPVIANCLLAATKAGSAFLGNTVDGLYDRNPAREARMQWMTQGGQNTGDHLRIILLFAGAARQIRIAAALGLRLPSGTYVRAELYDTHAATTVVGVSQGRLSELPGGAIGRWFVFPETVGAALRLDLLVYNDVNGAAAINAGTVFELGEIVAMQAADIWIESGWTDEWIDPTESELTRDSQPVRNTALAYRRFESTLSTDAYGSVYGGGLPGGTDWQILSRSLAGDARGVAIPRSRGPGGAIDLDLVQRHARYGVGRVGAIGHMGGDNYSAPFELDEVPAVP